MKPKNGTTARAIRMKNYQLGNGLANVVQMEAVQARGACPVLGAHLLLKFNPARYDFAFDDVALIDRTLGSGKT